jgi:hypothetical protein
MRILTFFFELLELLKPPSFSDTNDDNNIDNIDEFLRNRATNFQAKVDAIPWTAGTEGLWWPDYIGATLAPSPGLAYNEYYSSTRKYTKGHKKSQRKFKAILASYEAEPTYDGLTTGTTEYHENTTVLGECSGARIESGGRRPEDWYGNVEHFPDDSQQLNLYHPVHAGYYPAELASIFHPCTQFLLSTSIDSH